MSSRGRHAGAPRPSVGLPVGLGDDEAVRAFLQDRIALWAGWLSLMSVTFCMSGIVASFLADGVDGAAAWLGAQDGTLFQLGAAATFAAGWLVVRGRRPSVRTLQSLEAGLLIVGCTLYGFVGLDIVRRQQAIGLEPAIGMYAGLLAAAAAVTARAIAVPSTPKRTFWVSAAALIVLVPPPGAVTGLLATAANVAIWCGIWIMIATIGSRVIFGLRTEAVRARRIGQYTLEEKIGSGGMGVVYRASHAMLRRPTAIKLVPADRAGEANLLRFEREVQETSQLSHPNTVAIYDYGRTPDGLFYYAMEYLDGLNLEELVRRVGPLPAGRVVYILDQVCRALAEAHGRGLVHRDIKPANIVLTERGGESDVAKVVDFGLVKPVTAFDQATLPGTLMLAGTPLYMAPEVIVTSAKSDPRSDLYALGAVGYFLLTGHAVFDAASVAEVLTHHLQTEPVPPSLRCTREIPADLEALILQCLRKRMEDRPRDAQALQESLERCRVARRWTRAEAGAWWRTFRATPGQVDQRGLVLAEAGVGVDPERRLAQTITRSAPGFPTIMR